MQTSLACGAALSFMSNHIISLHTAPFHRQRICMLLDKQHMLDNSNHKTVLIRILLSLNSNSVMT